MYQNETKLAKRLAVEAGMAIMEIYDRKYEIEQKEDKSPLTEADKKGNEIIVKALKTEFPHYAILSEESKDDNARITNDYCFIVDPLDGTKEFIKKNGEFTVNIALAYRRCVVMGVIYVPAKRELYVATKGMGAYLTRLEEDNKTGVEIKLKVTDKTSDINIVGSKSHSSEKEAKLIDDNMEKINQIVSAGSSLKGCMVASGKADVYYRFGLTCEWDTAAMQCIVEEAGGIFRQMDHSEMIYNRENNLNEKGFYIVNRAENIWI